MRVHLRDNRLRPYIELEPTDHPLAIEQTNGIGAERVAEIYAYYERRQAQCRRRAVRLMPTFAQYAFG